MILWQNALTFAGLAAGYGLLCVYLPSLCLRGLVGQKPPAFRFFFYQACAAAYLLLWGWVLALLGWFCAPALWLVLAVGPLGLWARQNRRALAARLGAACEAAQALFSGMYGRRALVRNACGGLRRAARALAGRLAGGSGWEAAGLGLLLALVLWGFGWFHLTHEGFAAGEECVHLAWEADLLRGSAFPSGLAPHGLHFLTAALSAMLGLTLGRASMLVGPLLACLAFAALYLLLRQAYSRGPALFGMGFFLTVRVFSYEAYWRYQAALPMEAALLPCCAMLYGLGRYARDGDGWDLLLACLALAWCLWVDAGTGLLAALGYALLAAVFLPSLLRGGRLGRAALGGLAAAAAAAAPFLAGRALGYPVAQALPALSLPSGARAFWNAALLPVQSPAARILLPVLALSLVLAGLARRGARARLWLFWGLLWAAASAASAVSLFSREQQAVFLGFFSPALLAAPAQLAAHAARRFLRSAHARRGVAAAGVAAVFCLGAPCGRVMSGLTVEDGLVSEGERKACYRLVEQYPRGAWALVSTSFDCSFVHGSGYHYETAALLRRLDEGRGSLHLPLNDAQAYEPVRNLFVVVETRIDQYAGPDNRRRSRLPGDDPQNRGAPTPALALTPLPEGLEAPALYAYPWRGVVMSKLYYWMEKVKQTYPGHVSVFYSDQTVTVYHISQDEYFPLELMLDYRSGLG